MKKTSAAVSSEKEKRWKSTLVKNMPEVLAASHEHSTSPSLCEQAQPFVAEAKNHQGSNLHVKATKRQTLCNEAEFTFHPRVSTASTRMVENLGLDFLERQQRHVEKKLCAYEDNQLASFDEQTPKRSKVNLAKHRLTQSRPCTSDHNILKKRSKLPKNSIRRQSSVLELMDTNMEPITSPLPPPLPPRAKTYFPSTMTQSMASSGVYGGGMRKRGGNDPYANFDRLQKAKMLAEKAVKNKKIFSIHGPYPLIRKALRERGWVEKEFKLPLRLKGVNKPSGDSSDVDDDDDDYDDDDTPKDSGIGASPRPSFDSHENEENEPNDCYGIMGRMVRNEVPTFQWTTRTASIDWRFLQKDQMVNHYAKANFTTKVGLCINLRMMSCFSEGHSDTFFPRCYRLSNDEDKLDFIDDFRLSAASAILKIAVARHVDNASCQDAEELENGQLPPPGGSHVIPVSILQMAIQVCKQFGAERNHEDIDQDETVIHVSDESWDQLIFHYGKLVHEGATISQSGSYLKQCEDALSIIKERNPQFIIEGCKNTWIIKPGAKSRGRGIIVMNKLDEILKLVSGDSTLIKDSRWVVQKYIERPLLVYGTKFDVRQWFLVSDWNPVTVWIYKESYLRFSSRPFTLKNLEPCIHLCNYSVQKNFEVDPKRSSLLPHDNMWSDTDFKNYLRNRGCHTLWEDKVFPGMKKAIIHICQTAQDTVEYRKSSFELYGADFMIDEDYNPWLIEVNSSPTMSRSTSVTSKLCASVQEDTLKVILDRKRDKNCDVGLFELMYKQATVDVPLYVGKALNVDGVTIKKPSIPVRRPICQASSSSNNNPNNKSNNANTENSSLASKSIGRATSVYFHVVNKPPKSRMKQQASNNTSQSTRNHQDRAKTPVKIKMQTTMKRLTSEASNTPSRPNAFNLPKCPTTTVSGNQTTSSSQTTSVKPYPQNRVSAKANGSLYKLPASEDSPNQISNGSHLVSSPQAKAASTMGMMNLGSAYSSVVAAANRGYLPSKINHPYPPPQAVVPKTFPVSGVPGGDVLAGGSAVIHPAPPPGLVTLSPQTIGLSLPFQKYYNMHVEQTNQQSGNTMQKRGVTYGIQDFRLAGSHPRVSGIHEWVSQQRSGFAVTCYYPPNHATVNPVTKLKSPNKSNNQTFCDPSNNDSDVSFSPSLGSLAIPTHKRILVKKSLGDTDYEEFSKYVDKFLAFPRALRYKKLADGCPFNHSWFTHHEKSKRRSTSVNQALLVWSKSKLRRTRIKGLPTV